MGVLYGGAEPGPAGEDERRLASPYRRHGRAEKPIPVPGEHALLYGP